MRDGVHLPLPSGCLDLWLDVPSQSLEADFVVGADGLRSTVRRALRIEMVQHGSRQIYAFYDAPDQRAGDEAHLVFSGGYGASVYPLQGEQSRFSFQIGVGTLQPPGLTQLRQLLALRMPWYTSGVDGFEWSGSAEFHPALAARFGEGRVWLAGDAAHATGPLGGQSINVGMHEADDLALRIALSVDDAKLGKLGPRYCEQRRIEWGRLFGWGPSKPDTHKSPDWVRRHIGSLLPSYQRAETTWTTCSSSSKSGQGDTSQDVGSRQVQCNMRWVLKNERVSAIA